ncbi:MAG: hypothetical protein JXR75_00090 [Rhodobacteraceae bacterium]|nr:hypothetical protein [Paracoccaceae bacterium]
MAMNPAATFPQAASHDLTHGDDTSKSGAIALAVLASLVVAAGLAFMVWGPVALTITGLILVPLMFIFFVTISWPGKSRRED